MIAKRPAGIDLAVTLRMLRDIAGLLPVDHEKRRARRLTRGILGCPIAGVDLAPEARCSEYRKYGASVYPGPWRTFGAERF